MIKYLASETERFKLGWIHPRSGSRRQMDDPTPPDGMVAFRLRRGNVAPPRVLESVVSPTRWEDDDREGPWIAPDDDILDEAGGGHRRVSEGPRGRSRRRLWNATRDGLEKHPVAATIRA